MGCSSFPSPLQLVDVYLFSACYVWNIELTLFLKDSSLVTSPSDKISVGCHNSEIQLKMNLHVAFRYVGKTDSITISVWNHKKIHKKQGAGFLGCVRLLSNAISRLKDTGCKNQMLFCL